MYRVILICLTACQAYGAVKLAPAPQKFRTVYPKEASQVPSALRTIPGSLQPSATGPHGEVWSGSAAGLVLTAKGDPQFFAGKRYLPDDAVEAILPEENGVWVRTATGVSHIEMRPMTLAQKAAYFEERIALRHNRHGLVADSRLANPGDLSSSIAVPSDNDGLWTAIYSTAACFRYAVAPSARHLARAKEATEAILFLETVTGRPGFPARSFVVAGETPSSDGMWHWTSDGKYRFKGDTSSDEIVGHFFALAIAWDLLPDRALNARIAATAARIMDHILDHDLNLTDITGYPTYWGHWGEDYFSSSRGRGVVPALWDGRVEDRRVRREPGDRELADVSRERAAAEQRARDVVEPDALAGVVEPLRRLHEASVPRAAASSAGTS